MEYLPQETLDLVALVRWPGFVRQAELSTVIRLSGEDPVHDISAVHDHRADLLAVDRLCRGRAAVADQPGDVLDRHVGVGEQ